MSWSIRELPRDDSWGDKGQNLGKNQYLKVISIKYNNKNKTTFNEYFL